MHANRMAQMDVITKADALAFLQAEEEQNEQQRQQAQQQHSSRRHAVEAS